MPSIMEGSILVMSKAGTGTSMFCMGKLRAQFRTIYCYVCVILRPHIHKCALQNAEFECLLRQSALLN